MHNRHCIIYFVILLLSIACQSDQDLELGQTGAKTKTNFILKKANDTGVHFVNQVRDQADFNVITYRNFYNGGGVAIGDINNDGLADLYFTANLGSNKLYLNKGDFKFEDITDASRTSGNQAWSTGVTMSDVNADGLLDIYVSNSGDVKGDNKVNELFINNGDLTFTEQAEAFGLDNNGFSTQASFFDFDADGDLDCYLLNNSFKDPAKIELYKSMRVIQDDLSGDKLYRNDNGKFKDVTSEAGIYSSAIGFGLGSSIGDINKDYLPDIYVSNDFWERDYLYINNGDGTFTDEFTERINYSSISSMGGDIADINNDGSPEIISTDMLPADNYRIKAATQFDPYHVEDMKYRANYHYQIAQNCLHLNNGKGEFQEIAMISNVGATDWSWGALFFDFENDGWKDLFISNGLQRDLMNMDFRDYLSANQIHAKLKNDDPLDITSVISQMPITPLSNYAFSNNKNLVFHDQSSTLGLDQKSFSNGSAYGDLDNDGDLDLVVNNVNMQAFIYENKAEETTNHYLKIKFIGPETNPFGIGTTVHIDQKGSSQYYENYNSRGFQSSVEPILTIGLGQESLIEKMTIVWSDKKTQQLTNVSADQLMTIEYTDASIGKLESDEYVSGIFTDISQQRLIGNTAHNENTYNDFDHELLLPKLLSAEGPRILTGDLNYDDKMDFILLGAHDDEDKIFIQTKDGKFQYEKSSTLAKDKTFESTCGAIIDINGDGYNDVILGSGGNEYGKGRDVFKLRLYINDGNVQLTKDSKVNSEIFGNFSTIVSSDIDKDNDQDLFIGARLVPGNYGIPPRSFLLRNDNGKLEDIGSEELSGIGMVTDANFSDIDKDGDDDLIVVGDWMAVHIFINQEGDFSKVQKIENSHGWWNTIKASDLDSDGDLDFVIGNQGLNTKLQADINRPVKMLVNDFDNNGKSEFIINWYPPAEDKPYPFATKPEITTQLPILRKQILKYGDYANLSYDELFPSDVLQNSIEYKSSYTETAILWNDDDGFYLEALPLEAQLSPVFAVESLDYNSDGKMDLWLGGNQYGLKPQIGRQDASRGILLKNTGDRKFEFVPSGESGFDIKGEVKDVKRLKVNGEDILLIARNNNEALLYQLN